MDALQGVTRPRGECQLEQVGRRQRGHHERSPFRPPFARWPAARLPSAGVSSISRSSFSPVLKRLLEVVADDLVALDESRPCSSSQPANRSCSSARVALGMRVVGGVADQHVAEAVGVLDGSSGRSGRTSSLRTSASSCRYDGHGLGVRAPRPRRGGRARPSTAPRSSTARSPAVELLEPGREQRLDRRRHVARRRLRSRGHRDISSRKSGLPWRRRGSAPRVPGEPVAGERRERAARPSRRHRAARAARASHSARLRPAGPCVEQLGPRQAEQQERRVRARVGDVLDQVEERRLAPVDVVEDRHQRPLARRRPRAACASPTTISSPASPRACLAEQRADRLPRRASAPASSCSCDAAELLARSRPAASR